MKNKTQKEEDNKALLDHIEKYGPSDKLREEAMISDLANIVYIERLKLEKNNG